MAVRTIACLAGDRRTLASRRAAACSSRRARTSSSTSKALERPDLSPPVRTINMIRLGEALTTPDAGVGGPPVHAMIVYNSNPAAVAPDRNAVLRGMAREDLFTVVLEHFQTDTADYADIVLPATTQLEHWDLHAVVRPSLRDAQPSVDRADRRVAAEQRDLPPARGADGTRPSGAQDDDLTMIRQALDSTSREDAGRDVRHAAREGLDAAQRADAVPAVRERRIPDAAREVRVLLAAAGRDGTRSGADVHAAVRVPGDARRRSRRAIR